MASSQKSTRRRKKQQPVHTLEEVFNQVSSATESSLNAPPGRVVLTPRSAEACLKLGVNPEILKIRDIDSFWEPGIDAAVQRLRHEAYVQRRHDTMKACRLERKRIINAAFDAHGGFEPGNEGLTPEQLLKQQQEQSSTLIQMELARIEKMQKRQEKELEQMIQYEINRAKLQEDMTQRIEEARRREEERKRQADKRARLAAEEKRLKEMQRAAMEEMEEENRRQIAREMHQREKELADKREADLKAYKKRMMEEQKERDEKAAEHKATVQKYFADEQLRLRQRLESMNFHEAKKQAAYEEKAAQLAEVRAYVCCTAFAQAFFACCCQFVSLSHVGSYMANPDAYWARVGGADEAREDREAPGDEHDDGGEDRGEAQAGLFGQASAPRPAAGAAPRAAGARAPVAQPGA